MKRKHMHHIQDIIRRLQLGEGERRIARDMNISRGTVRKYHEIAKEKGYLEKPGAQPSEGGLMEALGPGVQAPRQASTVEPYRETIQDWVNQGVEMTAIWLRLQESYGYKGGYSSIRRFVHRLEGAKPEAFIRVHSEPGEDMQVDFGTVGQLYDPVTKRLRTAYVFVATLGYSRHQYAELVFDQKTATWIALHKRTFEYFGGVPQRVIPDNLKAAVIQALVHDPILGEAYRRMALYYGFLISPTIPHTPRHKGKVEQGGVHYVCRNFLGGRIPTTIHQGNRDVLVWCNTTAGMRIHGTTQEKPPERFEQVEKTCLKPLPESPYDLAIWKNVKLYRDGYVTFEKAFYSVPCRLYPGRVWICGGSRQVRIFDARYHLVTTHQRAQKPGERHTQLDHLPPEKVPGPIQDRDSLLAEAQVVGPATLQVIQTLLDDPILYRIPTAGRLVRLKNRFGAERLEAACRRALAFDDPSYKTIKRILAQGLEQDMAAGPVRIPAATTFARSVEELVAPLAEVQPWN